jgi:hypothetical protein
MAKDKKPEDKKKIQESSDDFFTSVGNYEGAGTAGDSDKNRHKGRSYMREALSDNQWDVRHGKSKEKQGPGFAKGGKVCKKASGGKVTAKKASPKKSTPKKGK